MKPDLSLYVGKKVTAITRGEQPWEWGIKFQGDVEIRNKDEREVLAPIGLVGMFFTHMSFSLHDTTMYFTGLGKKTERFSFNPTRYAIADPAHGGEVYPQWPEELEAGGITSVPGGEVSAEPDDPEGWAERRESLLREGDERRANEAAEFLKDTEEQ